MQRIGVVGGAAKWLFIPLVAGALFLISPLPADAAGKGAGGGMQSGGMMDGSGDRDRMRDQDRMRDMDQLRERIHQTDDPGERGRLMRQYHQRIEQGMRRLDERPGPGPNATQQERMQYMQQRMEENQRLMRHMWEYQNQTRGADQE